jgi:hypothetical protein
MTGLVSACLSNLAHNDNLQRGDSSEAALRKSEDFIMETFYQQFECRTN